MPSGATAQTVTPDAPIRLRLLGRLDVSIARGQPRTLHIGAPRRQALLAYLALRPTCGARRDHLAALLWDDDETSQARQNLRQALLELRRDLAVPEGQLIHADREQISLDKTAFSTDVAGFEQLVWSANPADHARAVSLCDGALLEGLGCPTRAFESWLETERERLRLLALPVFEKFAAAATTAGQDALASARRLVAMEPLDEAAQRLLLRTLALRLSRDAALAQADQFTRQLREELDAAPEPETVKLIAAIRDGALRATPDGRPATSDKGSVVPGAARPILGLGGRARPPSWQTPDRMKSTPIDKRALETRGIYAVVVLPLTTIGGAHEVHDRQLAQALTDDLIGDLSHTAALRVISSHTSSAFAGQSVDFATLGAELGVHYAIEGNLRSEGDDIRINLGLTDTNTRLRIWSESIATPSEEYLRSRQGIARGLAYRIFSRVLTEQAEHVPEHMADPSIEHLIAMGWAAQIQIGMTGSGLEAGEHFARVLAEDPGNLTAMIGLAGFKAMQVITLTAGDPEAFLDEAESLLRRAIERNPYASIAHHYLGLVEKARGHAAEAIASLNRAIEINPSFAPAYGALATLLARRGDPQAGMEHALYALRLSPRDASAGIWWLFAGNIQLELGGNDAQALEWLRQSVALNPRGPFGLASLAAMHGIMGDTEAAQDVAARLRAIHPRLTLDQLTGFLHRTSHPGHAPQRLITGLRRVFGS